ncbi:MAG: tRNA pseudouridine(38-40) synthase TruA [Bdellovibrionales bacterium]|nr:tRNA pseudouridine(38-40) synthase TruA [Bdellovibrionales bacterium]
MNIRLTIEYDGSDYRGWQRQDGAPSIQETIENAIEKVVGERVPVKGASRTDSGVHAAGQVANFICDRYEASEWRKILNALLPATIRILESVEAADSFDACRDARSKIYDYRVLNRRFASALDRRVYFYARPLDWEGIARCLPLFVGQKDFAAFRGAGSSAKTSVRTIHRFEVVEESTPGLYRFRVEGTGFLKQMVRAMVGTVIEVGEGRRSVEGVREAIESKDRRCAGRTVPASGLCLTSVQY